MDQAKPCVPDVPNLPVVADAAPLLDLLSMGQPDAVRALEAVTSQMPQVILETDHAIHGGIYARTIFIPKGTVLTGAETRHDNVCVVVGDITVTTDSGPVRLTGHHVITAKSGSKRVGLAHADTLWTTLVATDKTTVEAIEDDMTGESVRLQTRCLGIDGRGA